MSNLTDFIGGGDVPVLAGYGLDCLEYVDTITTSGTWSPTTDGKYFIITSGGGGSGSAPGAAGI